MDGSAKVSVKTGSSELAQLIRDRRKQLGMSRQDLAEVSGVPYPTIAQIETAYRGVSPNRLGVIARALGLEPKELYEVLTSDTTSESGGSPSFRSSGRAGFQNEGPWHANPAYVPAAAVEPAPAAAAMPPPPDVVGRIVELLLTLDPAERLEALGRVQTRLMTVLIEEEVRRARHEEG